MIKKVIKTLGILSAVTLARLLPFNWIIGSKFAMFSWSSVFAPVLATQFGLVAVGGFLLSKKLWTTSLLLSLCHRLPLFVSARAFVRQDFLTTVIVPPLCMMLFMVHPVGAQAWMYSLYWLIPVALYQMDYGSWSRALSASFVAHAVGSVVWLYTGLITSPAVWLALIPVVVCERLLMSLAIVVCNELCLYFKKKFSYYLQRLYVLPFKV